MFRKVLVANRAEIAVRIFRTLREMGITSVAAFSEADRDALFVQEADENCLLGPAPASESYLNIDAILSVARQAEVDAIHPGYGFLAENAGFAQAVAEAGLSFIGPPVAAMERMGDKVRARRSVKAAGVPVVPGTADPVKSASEALAFAEEVGYPIAVKAAGGGGGRGIRTVWGPSDMGDALNSAAREAQTHFGNADVYLERYFSNPKHVEIQVLGDRRGHQVHLGERDCSVQRRHQKLMEETPSPSVDIELRDRMGEMALRAAGPDYFSAGTVEFLLTDERGFYFLEMNTRIQVEHPITEAVSGLDLIREQVLIAAGEPMTVRDSLSQPNGHAIEVRINAEDPIHDFRPSPATVSRYVEPGGPGVRVDSGICTGSLIPGSYDSLITKLITWAPDREICRRRQLRALAEYQIEGPATTIPFAKAVLQHPAFVRGDVGTNFVEMHWGELESQIEEPRSGPVRAVGGTVRDEFRTFEVEVNGKAFSVRVAEANRPAKTGSRPVQAPKLRHRAGAAPSAVVSPIHGTVIAIKKQVGDLVEEGDTLVVVEAMKMENDIGAHRSGRVTSLDVRVGDSVEAEQKLAVIE